MFMRSSKREVDKSSLSYIRGRYGADSEEYQRAKAELCGRPKKIAPKNNEVHSDIILPIEGETPLEFVKRKRAWLKKQKEIKNEQ